MTDRGLGVLVSVLSVLMLVLILTMTIQKSFFERDKDGYSAFVRMTGSAEDELTVSGGYSMQQAYAICKKRAVEQIGINLLSLHFDALQVGFINSKMRLRCFWRLKYEMMVKIIKSL